MFVASGKDSQLAVQLDAHRHLGAHQAQAFRADPTNEKAPTGNTNLSLRRARHHSAVGIAHDNVANAQRWPSVRVTLELSAADLDLVSAAEILLDRCAEPRSCDIQFNRTARQAPPEGDHREQYKRTEGTAAQGELAQTRPPREQSGPQAEAIEPGRLQDRPLR